MKDDTGENGYITATIAKCYLRQLTEYGYLESHGGNRNRTYRVKTSISEYDLVDSEIIYISLQRENE